MLSYERVNELLRYDAETGKIYRKVDVGKKIKAGSEAGSLKHNPRNVYRQIGIDGKIYHVHRVAWLLHYGEWPKNKIDHCDGNGLNNRPENMRDATNQENMKNTRMYQTNTSGFTGVFWDKHNGKWLARIKINGKHKHLGCFNDITEAEKVRKQAAREHGFTERHGVAE